MPTRIRLRLSVAGALVAIAASFAFLSTREEPRERAQRDRVIPPRVRLDNQAERALLLRLVSLKPPERRIAAARELSTAFVSRATHDALVELAQTGASKWSRIAACEAIQALGAPHEIGVLADGLARCSLSEAVARVRALAIRRCDDTDTAFVRILRTSPPSKVARAIEERWNPLSEERISEAFVGSRGFARAAILRMLARRRRPIPELLPADAVVVRSAIRALPHADALALIGGIRNAELRAKASGALR